MKSIFTIFLCLQGVTVLFAQEQPAAMIHETGIAPWGADSTITFFTYTPAQQIASSTIQKRNDSGGWENLRKTSYTYNNAGQLTEMTLSQWWDNTGWRNTERHLLSYTTNGWLEIDLTQNWGWLDSWIDDSRLVTYYNQYEAGADSMVLMGWNSATETWMRQGRWAYSWDISNLLLQQIHSTMDSDGEWKIRDRDTIMYTAFGEIAQTLHSTYDENLAQPWVHADRQTNTYNAAELLTLVEMEHYSTNTNSWIGGPRITYTYHPDNSKNQEIYFWFNEELGAFVPSTRYTWVYGDYFLGLSETAFAAGEVFPNPTQADVQIRFEQVTTAELILTDLQGKILSTQAVSGVTATIPLEAFPAGTYLLNIRSGNQNGVRRIAKL